MSAKRHRLSLSPLKSGLGWTVSLSDNDHVHQSKQHDRFAGRQRHLASFATTAVPESTGLFQLLPIEIIEQVLRLCTPRDLARVECTSRFFHQTQLAESVCEDRVKKIPRGKGMKPSSLKREKWLTLFHFFLSQSQAAAQATAVNFGCNHSAALLVEDMPHSKETRHSIYTWGRGFHGQMGDGTYQSRTRPVNISLGYHPCKDKGREGMEEELVPAVLSCGGSHSTSVTCNGQLFCWGLATSGELGGSFGSASDVPLPTRALLPLPSLKVVLIAAGVSHTLALTGSGAMFACGRNNHGQLGLGLERMDDAHSLVQVNALRGWRIVSAAAGESHSLALSADGTIFSWGDGRHGELGLSALQFLGLAMPGQAMVIPSPQKVRELDPATLDTPDRVTAIAAGRNHSVALTVSGRAFAFGRNDFGMLGTGDTSNRWAPCEVHFDGSDEDPTPSTSGRIVQVVCGGYHTLALVMAQGRMHVRATGRNHWGQLGQDSLGNTCRAVAVKGLPPSLTCIQAGFDHSAAVTTEGRLYLWGRGDWGEMARGTRSSWLPRCLPGFTVVHPDSTLRANKRPTPRVRAIGPGGRPCTYRPDDG